MTDLTFGIQLKSSGGQQVAGDISQSAEAVNRLNTSAEKLNISQGRLSQSNDGWRKNMAGVAASMRETSAASVELSSNTQRILDRYDPLGTKLRSLQADMATLRREMGNSTTDAAIKGFQGLEDEIDKTRNLMGEAGVAADVQAKSMTGLGLHTQYARRELMMLGREALTGDFSQMPHTFASLVTHSNLLHAAISPIGIAVVGVTATLAAGAVAFHHYENVAVESADAVIKAIDTEYDARERMAGMSVDSIGIQIRHIDQLLVAQEAYASHVSHNVTRFNWRSSAEELKKLNDEMARSRMLRGQLSRQTPIAESESALKASLAANKKAQDDARREEQAAAKKADAEARVEAKRYADYVAGIDKDRLYATIAEDKAARIAHSQFLLTMELGRIKDTAQAEQEANQEAANAAIREYLRRGEAQAEAIKKQTEDWKKFTGDIESSLTDSLMRGFEAGNSFGENFVRSLENTLKTAALKVVVQAMVNPVMGGIGAMAQGGSFMSGASAAGSLGNIGGLVGGFGSAIGSGAVADFGAGLAGTFMGPALPGSAASIGASIGAAMPYIGAAVLAYSLLKGNGGTPTASTGHAVIDYNAAGAQTNYQSLYGVQNTGTDSFVAGMEASYMQYAKALGIGTVGTQFGYATNTGENGKQPNFGLSGGGFVQGETAYSEAAVSEAASRAVFAALQGSDLPEYLAGVFDGLDAAKMSGQDISNTLAFAGALKQVRDGLTSTATPISVAQDALDKIGSTAASFTADFVAAIDTGMTPEKLAQWQAAGAALGSLGDMSLTMTAAVPQLTQSTWEMWNTQTNSVRGLISTFDGSVEATYALSAATRERYATEQQLVNQISGAMSSLGAMFAGSAEQMQLSVMDAQAKSNYFVDQANSLQLQMEAATDPARIEELARSYNEASNNAWANLDDTQRKLMLDSYLANTEQVNHLVQDKLGRTLDEITQDSKNELPALIAQAVENAMTAFVAAQQAVADAQAAAANTMQSAANTMQTVADKPVNVKVDVDFNADVLGSSQVAVLP